MERIKEFINSIEVENTAKVVKHVLGDVEEKIENYTKSELEKFVLDKQPDSYRAIVTICYVIGAYAKWLDKNYPFEGNTLLEQVNSIDKKQLWKKIKPTARKKFVTYPDLKRVINLVYKSGYHCDIKPDYRNEYNYFITALEGIALKEKISIEPVLVSNKKIFPFPGSVDSLSGYIKLCVKATIIISGNTSQMIKTEKQKQIDESVKELKKQEEQNNANWAMTGKCILVVGIIILAFIICLNADMGPLGMALLLIGSVVLGCIILMKSSK